MEKHPRTLKQLLSDEQEAAYRKFLEETQERTESGKATRTHCKNGHPYEENRYVSPSGKVSYCKLCQKERHCRYLQRSREEIAALRKAANVNHAPSPEPAARTNLARMCLRICALTWSHEDALRWARERKGAMHLLKRCLSAEPYPPTDLAYDVDWAQDVLEDLIDATRRARAVATLVAAKENGRSAWRVDG